MTVIPWDFNMSQVHWTHPCGYGAGDEDLPLSYRLLTDAEYVENYKAQMTSFLDGAGSQEGIDDILDAIPDEAAAMIAGDRAQWVRDNAAVRVPGMLDELGDLTICPEVGEEW